MRARFIGSGDPTDSAVCEAFGKTYPLGEWVEGDFHPMLSSNPTFETEGGDTPEVTTEDVDALRAQLDAKGIAYHHKAGAKKLADLLAAVNEPDADED